MPTTSRPDLEPGFWPAVPDRSAVQVAIEYPLHDPHWQSRVVNAAASRLSIVPVREVRGKMDEIPNPYGLTEADFRKSRWSIEALKYPLSPEAVAVRCSYNGISPDIAPKTWHYAPNEWVRNDLEQKAADRWQP